MFKIIKYKSSDGIKKKLNYCIYDSDKVSEETVIRNIKRGDSSRNMFIIRARRYGGIIEKMVDYANKYIEQKGDEDNENNGN